MRVEHVPHDRPDARLATADTRPARHTHRSQDARRPAAFLHRTENILISYQNYCRLSKTTHHCRLATHIHGNTTVYYGITIAAARRFTMSAFVVTLLSASVGR